MKRIKFLAMAFATLVMFSCSKENISDVIGSAEKANVTIKLIGSGNDQLKSKAAGGVTTADATINNYTALLFRADGTLDASIHYHTDGTNATIEGTTLAAKVYIVANTGSSTLFNSITTEAQLTTVIGNLMNGSAPGSASTQTSSNLFMVGSGNVTISGSTGTATVALNFVAAKINVIVKDNRTNMTGGTITIQDNAVVLLFAGAHAKFFQTPANQAIQNTFFTGDNSYTDPFATNVTLQNVLSDAVATPFTANATQQIFNHFYTFPNDGATQATILAIKSTKTIAGVSSTVYYPIQFTATDAGMTIEPGKSYDVILTLTGDVNSGGGVGVTDPETEVGKADITVTVRAALWEPVTVTKEFN